MQTKITRKIIIDKHKLDILMRLGCAESTIMSHIIGVEPIKTGDALTDEILESLVDYKEFDNWGGTRQGAGRPKKNQLENQDDKINLKIKMNIQDENQLANQDTIQVVDKDIDIDKDKKKKKDKKETSIYSWMNTDKCYKRIGEKQSIPLTKEQWDWYSALSILPGVKIRAVEILEGYLINNPQKLKTWQDLSYILGRGWAFQQAKAQPHNYENQILTDAALKRVGLL